MDFIIITSAKEVMFSPGFVCLSVCLSVRLSVSNMKKGNVRNGTRNNCLNFGGDSDLRAVVMSIFMTVIIITKR